MENVELRRGRDGRGKFLPTTDSSRDRQRHMVFWACSAVLHKREKAAESCKYPTLQYCVNRWHNSTPYKWVETNLGPNQSHRCLRPPRCVPWANKQLEKNDISNRGRKRRVFCLVTTKYHCHSLTICPALRIICIIPSICTQPAAPAPINKPPRNTARRVNYLRSTTNKKQ